MIEYIDKKDILGRPYDPREVIEKDDRKTIDDLFGEELEVWLQGDLTHTKMQLREVLLELIGVHEIGLRTKVTAEGWTKDNLDALGHIQHLIEQLPIQHEQEVLGEALEELRLTTPTPDHGSGDDGDHDDGITGHDDIDDTIIQ